VYNHSYLCIMYKVILTTQVHKNYGIMFRNVRKNITALTLLTAINFKVKLLSVYLIFVFPFKFKGNTSIKFKILREHYLKTLWICHSNTSHLLGECQLQGSEHIFFVMTNVAHNA